MFELVNSTAPRRPVSLGSAPAHLAEAGTPQRWLAHMLDEVDYGMLLVTGDTHLVHANKAARRDLDAQHPLQLLGHELRARLTLDVAPLRSAVAAAENAGTRRLLRLGDATQRCTVAVVPLAPGADGVRPVLLVLGRRKVCEELSVENFARANALTMSEAQVLKGLCTGLAPQRVAQSQGVALSTVRTQIGSIRAKTGADSIRTLLAQVAQLPPMVSALGGTGPLPALAA